MASFVRIAKTTFLDGRFPVFKNISFEITKNQNWAVVGAVGSGRTTFLKCLKGSYTPSPATNFKYPFLSDTNKSPWQAIQFLDFQSSGLQRAAYYSERYHSHRDKREDISLQKWLLDAYRGPEEKALEKVQYAASITRLEHLLESSLINLSNGQSRRAMLAVKLLLESQLLLLDEPYAGLDVASRSIVSNLLGNMSSVCSPKIVLSLRQQDEIPDFVTHIVELNNHEITYQGVKDHYHPSLNSAVLTKPQLEDTKPPKIGKPIIEMNNLNCTYWGKPVLENVNWTIKEGERWSLSGSNGSGKTTLLAFALGDHPKLFATDIKFFGKFIGPGTGISVFDIQENVGHCSPEVHTHFPKEFTCRETLLSAWSTTFTLPRETESRSEAIRKLLDELSLRSFENIPLSQLPTGMQRFILFCRAIIKRPRFLVLDEPFQGVDIRYMHQAHKWLNKNLLPSQAMVIISHYEEEIPACVNARAHVHQGKLRIDT
ncbi:ATPase [Schizosaccharomyces cryophilus OY26]|uniref:ATPase n=1 Tax=Schizosaccharomyces cryophilus (strain OY26 / ATCC MYA-4695 / CBS 11777 / NBRC 106824 / NRRL Y48691) TaxID=653667 RepID=S9W0C9_SCHCR|nr:ATPase [Schizosaccharomyces cryophilus OY26]EPY51515.1 ATPase [Schizosaccharomyces cryophilus OY26]